VEVAVAVQKQFCFFALQRPEREKKDRAHGVGSVLSFFVVDV
jgi:hypothetical protein